MKPYLTLLVLVALSFDCSAKEIRTGSTVEVKPNSIWFKEAGNLTHWQQLKKSGDAEALATYQYEVLSQRDASQFVHPVNVRVLRYESAKKRAHVEIKGEGRLAGTKWWLDAESLTP